MVSATVSARGRLDQSVRRRKISKFQPTSSIVRGVRLAQEEVYGCYARVPLELQLEVELEDIQSCQSNRRLHPTTVGFQSANGSAP